MNAGLKRADHYCDITVGFQPFVKLEKTAPFAPLPSNIPEPAPCKALGVVPRQDVVASAINAAPYRQCTDLNSRALTPSGNEFPLVKSDAKPHFSASISARMAFGMYSASASHIGLFQHSRAISAASRIPSLRPSAAFAASPLRAERAAIMASAKK